MGLGIKFALYLVAFFVMIVLALLRILPVNYLGEIVIVLFISGLCYSWLNTWRQTDKLIEKEETSKNVEEGRNEAPIAA